MHSASQWASHGDSSSLNLRQEHEAACLYLGRPEAEIDSPMIAKTCSPGTHSPSSKPHSSENSTAVQNRSTSSGASVQTREHMGRYFILTHAIMVIMCLDHKV